MATNKIKLTRNQIAKISADHDIIRQIELLIDKVNELEARVTALETP